MKKRFLAFLMSLALFLLPSMSASASAVNYDQHFWSVAQESADYLYQLGLFRGVGTLASGSVNFDLNRTPTRGEAITMLVRLLGAENAALNGSYQHPFADAGWADRYVAYAYANGISTGISPNQFGTNERISCNQFLTLVLRALGYNSVDWQNPYDLADAVGLFYADEEFLRADIAVICCSALDCPLNGQSSTLYEFLKQKGALKQGQTQTPPTQPDPPSHSNSNHTTSVIQAITVTSCDDMIEKFVGVMNSRSSSVVVNVPKGSEYAYQNSLLQQINRFQDVTSLSVSYQIGSGKFTVTVTYNDAVRVMAFLEGKLRTLSQEDQQMLRTAQDIHASLVNDTMSDYEKVKVFHDYLVNHNIYQETGDRSHSAIGALVDGQAVCDGYTKAFDLLCYLSGIDCFRITGVGYNNGTSERHSWNKVKLDGSWYNVDVTWDDPVGNTAPTPCYDYFLVCDNTLALDHQWKLYPHWPTATKNYQ